MVDQGQSHVASYPCSEERMIICSSAARSNCLRVGSSEKRSNSNVRSDRVKLTGLISGPDHRSEQQTTRVSAVINARRWVNCRTSVPAPSIGEPYLTPSTSRLLL